MEPNTCLRTQHRSGRHRQILRSVPHYFKELRAVRNPGALYTWLQFKLPYLLPIPSFPPTVTLELTNRCNFACIYCHREVMNRQIGTMDYGLLQSIVSEISRHGNSLVKIGGLGEPSLYPHCDKLMRFLRDGTVRSIFYTNGSLLHRLGHDQVLEWQIPHLVVSIDGIDCESYERQRVGGNYDQLRAALQAFRMRRAELGHTKPLIEVRHVIMPQETGAQLADFRRTWMDLADTVMFNHIVPSGPVSGDADTRSRRCRDIRREMYIRWDGRVPVCGYQYLVDKQEWIADLHDSTIRDAWHHNMLNELRRLHLRGGAGIPAFCAVCSQTA